MVSCVFCKSISHRWDNLFQLICPCLPLHHPLWLETVSLSPAPSLPPVELVALQSFGGRDQEMEILALQDLEMEILTLQIFSGRGLG